MAEDNWQTAYEATERLHRSILAELGDRGRLPRSSIGYNQSTQRLRSTFSELTSNVTSLRSSLGTLGSQLTSHELNRRRNLLENLSRKMGSVRDEIQDSSSMNRNSAARGQLLADLGTTSWGATPGGQDHLPSESRRSVPYRSGVRETDSSAGVETGLLRSDQDRLLAEQEQGLDMLGEIIRRQKGMGENIYREVTQQNDIIDDIDDRVETVNQRLIDTTSNVNIITKRDRTCGYWIVIVLLAIAIIVVIFA